MDWTAFALIELLVVIAVIAILAALMLPALAQAQERGKSATRLSNLRQLSLATHLYTDDNEASTQPGVSFPEMTALRKQFVSR